MCDGLLEVECHHYHAARGAIERLSKLEQILVDEVATVFYQQIHETKAELHLWDELKERQIEITAHAHLEGSVKAACEQCLLLLYREVHHRSQTCHYIGSVVVESLSGIFYIDRHRYIGRLYRLLLFLAAILFVKDYSLIAKVHRRDKAQ